ncbi:hypothetical protein M9458_013593, partial [Cirrhinus mrigala]
TINNPSEKSLNCVWPIPSAINYFPRFDGFGSIASNQQLHLGWNLRKLYLTQ